MGFTRVNAQSVSPENEIYTAVTHGILGQGIESFNNLPKEKQFMLFSIIVEIDNEGKTNKVVFTKPSNHADSLIRYKQVSDEIKRDKKNVFKNYKNSIYVLPILIIKRDLNQILLTPEFLDSFAALIPTKDHLTKSKRLTITRTYTLKIGDIQY